MDVWCGVLGRNLRTLERHKYTAANNIPVLSKFTKMYRTSEWNYHYLIYSFLIITRHFPDWHKIFQQYKEYCGQYVRHIKRLQQTFTDRFLDFDQDREFVQKICLPLQSIIWRRWIYLRVAGSCLHCRREFTSIFKGSDWVTCTCLPKDIFRTCGIRKLSVQACSEALTFVNSFFVDEAKLLYAMEPTSRWKSVVNPSTDHNKHHTWL
jgi:hypothetical protein